MHRPAAIQTGPSNYQSFDKSEAKRPTSPTIPTPQSPRTRIYALVLNALAKIKSMIAGQEKNALDPKISSAGQNVDQRREFLAKMSGVKRMVYFLQVKIEAFRKDPATDKAVIKKRISEAEAGLRNLQTALGLETSPQPKS